MSLSAEQLRLRDGKTTASFLPALMAGDEARILSEWKRLVGDPSYVPDNLDDIWAVQLGTWIEPFALDWHQKKTGRALMRRGEVVTHPSKPYVSCTLDAYRADDGFVLDVKAIGAYRKLDEVCAYYAPQIVVQKACLSAKGGALLIVHGGGEPVEHPIDVTLEYEAQVWARVDWFWECVTSLTCPVSVAPVAANLTSEWRQFDLDALDKKGEVWPNWAYAMQSDLASWQDTHAAAKNNARATKAIKELLPADVNKLAYAGVLVARAKNGAVTIKEKE